MGKTEIVTRLPLLSLLVLLLLLLSVHVSEASPGHLVHKFYKNQIQREEGHRNARNVRNGAWTPSVSDSPVSLLLMLATSLLLSRVILLRVTCFCQDVKLL